MAAALNFVANIPGVVSHFLSSNYALQQITIAALRALAYMQVHSVILLKDSYVVLLPFMISHPIFSLILLTILIACITIIIYNIYKHFHKEKPVKKADN